MGLWVDEVSRLLKRDPTLRAVPKIAITGSEFTDGRAKLLSAEFDGCITTPINPETFLYQVKLFLQIVAARAH